MGSIKRKILNIPVVSQNSGNLRAIYFLKKKSLKSNQPLEIDCYSENMLWFEKFSSKNTQYFDCLTYHMVTQQMGVRQRHDKFIDFQLCLYEAVTPALWVAFCNIFGVLLSWLLSFIDSDGGWLSGFSAHLFIRRYLISAFQVSEIIYLLFYHLYNEPHRTIQTNKASFVVSEINKDIMLVVSF